MRMKKLPLFFLALITLTGCTLIPQKQLIQEDDWTILTDTIPYVWTLTIAGIWPDQSFESRVESDTLVIKKTFEDHSDHIFIDRQSWSNYLDIQEDLIPGNVVKFVGTVKVLDAAAGNHYYQVLTIDELTKIAFPNQEAVEALIEQYSYCEQDTDCVGIYGKCPLSCHIAINTKFQATVEKIIDNFWNNQESQCMYNCRKIWKVFCNNYRCGVGDKNSF